MQDIVVSNPQKIVFFFLKKNQIKKWYFLKSSLTYFDHAIGAVRLLRYRSTKNILPKFDNFMEAVVNLFMKLQALNLTKFDDLGVKLKKIEPQIWNLWQFYRFLEKNVKYQKAFGE